MITREFDPVFVEAVRAELARTVQEGRRPGLPRLQRRGWIAVSAVLGAGLLGTAGAAAAGIFAYPGGEQETTLGPTVIETHTGTAAIQLGRAPAGTTHIVLSFTCLSAGRFGFADGSASDCAASDAGTGSGVTGVTLPYRAGETSTTVTTTPDARWRVEAHYANEVRRPLGVNARGQSFGVMSDSNDPDLVLVEATNGRPGYAFRSDLARAENGDQPAPTTPAEALQRNRNTEGKAFDVPVYESDGTTKIGTFTVGG